MVRSCFYFGCNNAWGKGNKALFRFPYKDSERLAIWIRNCGNKKISNDPKESFRHKCICSDHFHRKYFLKNVRGKLTRISSSAVPIPYNGLSSIAVDDLLTESKSQGFRETKMNEAQKKRLIGPAIRYGIFQDGMTEELNKDNALEIDDITCQPEEDCQVQKPKKVYHNYHKQICAEIAKESNRSSVTVVENYCMECERPIRGFKWWCLQCSGVRCGKCAVRMSHRAHYILRTPANSTQEQTEAVLEAIRRHMGEDFFVRQPDIRHVDENGVDLTATDEPEVKAEPFDIDNDPFDPFACNRLEHDPLACNTAEDPLAECKPVVQDIPLAEPSIDYQPGNSINPQSPINLDQIDQNSPQKPLRVELYSPVHPRLEAYEISLAQCSGIDDFMCSERIPIDSQSIDQPEGQIDPHEFDDNRLIGDDHGPLSIQPRVPTRFTYGEDNSEDCLEAIDYEQPSHSHIDTEFDDAQITRPWVQVLSSKEQNNTVKTIQHKTQQKRLVVQPPPSKDQNILAKQQNIQTKRPWVQVFSSTEQKSADGKQKNPNRSEELHFEDICEEQSSTITEIQDCHDPLEQSDNEEQVPTATMKRNSCEKQTSTTAKRKRKIIIIKKRNHALYTTGIQREFTEPIDDKNVQSTDMNTTTELTNTLFNLDDKKIATIKKRPRTQYATHIQRDFPELSDDNINIDNIQRVRDTLDLNMTSEATNTLLNLDEYVRDRVLEYPVYPPNIE